MVFQAHVEKALRDSDLFRELGLALGEETDSISVFPPSSHWQRWNRQPSLEFLLSLTFCLFPLTDFLPAFLLHNILSTP